MVLVELAAVSLFATWTCCICSCIFALVFVPCGLYHCFSYREQKSLHSLFKELEKQIGREDARREKRAHSVLSCLFFPCYYHYAMLSGIKMYNNAKGMGITVKEGGGEDTKKASGAAQKGMEKPAAGGAKDLEAQESDASKGLTTPTRNDMVVSISTEAPLAGMAAARSPGKAASISSDKGAGVFDTSDIGSGVCCGWTASDAEDVAAPSIVTDNLHKDLCGVLDLTTDGELSDFMSDVEAGTKDTVNYSPVRFTPGMAWGRAAVAGTPARESVDMVSLGKSFDCTEVSPFTSTMTVQPVA